MGDSAHTTRHTSPEKFRPFPFFGYENIFQKSAPLVPLVIPKESLPTEPIFEKCSHLREKGGVLMLLKKAPHLLTKEQ
jgi:hypothetical protein